MTSPQMPDYEIQADCTVAKSAVDPLKHHLAVKTLNKWNDTGVNSHKSYFPKNSRDNDHFGQKHCSKHCDSSATSLCDSRCSHSHSKCPGRMSVSSGVHAIKVRYVDFNFVQFKRDNRFLERLPNSARLDGLLKASNTSMLRYSFAAGSRPMTSLQRHENKMHPSLRPLVKIRIKDFHV